MRNARGGWRREGSRNRSPLWRLSSTQRRNCLQRKWRSRKCR